MRSRPASPSDAGPHDLLIVGAGCAGLSLAVALVNAGVRRRIVLLDERTDYARRDRTWCYWDVARHPFEDAVAHRWNRWSVGRDGEAPTIAGGRYAYCHVPGDRFYAAARERLSSCANVEWRAGCRVAQLRDEADGVTALTSDGPVRGAVAFDSRPTPPTLRPGDVAFFQQFVGLFVRADRPTFEPTTVRLMDFAPSRDAGIRFVYLLPFSATEALVEATAIGEADVPRATLEATARGYLASRFAGRAFDVTGREHGRLPMTTAPTPVRRSPRVYATGLSGGAGKPSTGYAFLAIQRWSAAMAARVAAGEADGTLARRPPTPPPFRPALATLLDRVFLSYLRRYPADAPALFAALFARVPADALVRFLTDAAAPLDALRVIAALPKLPFVLEALRSCPLWLLPRSTTSPAPPSTVPTLA